MFRIWKTFRHECGYQLTPIEMQGGGFVFLPKELERQLGYENLSKVISQSESFAENSEYLVLKDANLFSFKELLNRGNAVTSVDTPIGSVDTPIGSVDEMKHCNALIVLTEPGLNCLLNLSRKPEMAGFRKWVVSEVFGAMRPAVDPAPGAFHLAGTFTHHQGFRVTPIEMQGVGFVFLPQELEEQLDYEDLALTLIKSDSFAEGMEYVVLRDHNLRQFKELLNSLNSIQLVRNFKHSPSLTLLTESGLYAVVLLSRKPGAVVFRRWVTGEVLPGIRKTGACQLWAAPGLDASRHLPAIVEKIGALERVVDEQNDAIGRLERIVGEQNDTICRLERIVERQSDAAGRWEGVAKKWVRLFSQNLHEQVQFQEDTLQRLSQIDAVLADCKRQHDIFSGWRMIRKLVDDMTEIYGLGDGQRRKYFRDLCRANGIDLPAAAVPEDARFLDVRAIAERIDAYSSGGRPHAKLVGALIRHLGLEKYRRKVPALRSGCRASLQYSESVVPLLRQWLRERGFPEAIEIPCGEGGRSMRFHVKYPPQGALDISENADTFGHR